MFGKKIKLTVLNKRFATEASRRCVSSKNAFTLKAYFLQLVKNNKFSFCVLVVLSYRSTIRTINGLNRICKNLFFHSFCDIHGFELIRNLVLLNEDPTYIYLTVLFAFLIILILINALNVFRSN